MVRTFENDLKNELQDLEAARYFGAANAKSSFAITLSKARKNMGLTQQELAHKVGVSQSYIAKLEGGEANPTLEKIGNLLAVLGLSLTTDVAALSPYPVTPTWQINWPSDAWLIPPPVEPLQFTNVDISDLHKTKILTL